MKFMNEYDIERARRDFRGHPALAPAVETLDNLRRCANANSDGWAYWPKPARAAAKLMELLEGNGTNEAREFIRHNTTAAQVRVAYRPIKAFLTRAGLTCELIEPQEVS
jgi:MoxR-like ATPase